MANAGAVDWAAFAIVLAAVLCFIFVYLLVPSKSLRAKVNKSAIGKWSTRTKWKWEWNFLGSRWHILYARPSLVMEEATTQFVKRDVYSAMQRHALEQEYVLREDSASLYRSASGIQVKEPPTISIYRRGSEDQAAIEIRSLPKNARQALQSIQKTRMAAYTPSVPCKASWYNLMSDLGLDPLESPAGYFIDADTIPSMLDAPPMHICTSDLIRAGFLLDMALNKAEFDPENAASHLTMTGKSGSITTSYLPGVGTVARYSSPGPNILPASRRLSSSEARSLLATAYGTLCIGDSRITMNYLGYNAVNAVFDAALSSKEESGGDWQQIRLEEGVWDKVETDEDAMWAGRWKDPKTPAVPFFLAICANMAIANSFPHSYLESWGREERNKALSDAFKKIEDGPKFIVAPHDLITRIKKADQDIVVLDEYKTANPYGCEFGGYRGWLSSNHALFTLRMSKCWAADDLTDSVPLLYELERALRSGELDQRWAEECSSKYKYPARPVLWLQITMLDTWLARHIDMLMGGNGLTEVSVPADMTNAERCNAISNRLPDSTGWPVLRLQFTKHYLKRLAEGVEGEGVSCMSPGSGCDSETAWQNMEIGKTEDWSVIDAVLTLRALLMAVQLERMKDSSIVLKLSRFDPIILLA